MADKILRFIQIVASTPTLFPDPQHPHAPIPLLALAACRVDRRTADPASTPNPAGALFNVTAPECSVRSATDSSVAAFMAVLFFTA